MSITIPDLRIADFIKMHPYVADFFSTIGQYNIPQEYTLQQWLNELSDEVLEEAGFDREHVMNYLTILTAKLKNDLTRGNDKVNSVTIFGGHNKSGEPEKRNCTLHPGEIVCIVGPTGSGKSRLLGDIECLAQGDTPTGRKIFVNGTLPDSRQRFALDHKLVAQISQNMNFVVDLTVREFITMHAKSRMVAALDETVADSIRCANELTGEQFTPDSSVTQLSGGQSRALMIADTALLSKSPIILIDEIENAGVDRKKALELLVKKEKIVLISTHDPLLAFMGGRRIVIKNGGIADIIESTPQEQKNLIQLEALDRHLTVLRDRLRRGERIDDPLTFCQGV